LICFYVFFTNSFCEGLLAELLRSGRVRELLRRRHGFGLCQSVPRKVAIHGLPSIEDFLAPRCNFT